MGPTHTITVTSHTSVTKFDVHFQKSNRYPSAHENLNELCASSLPSPQDLFRNGAQMKHLKDDAPLLNEIQKQIVNQLMIPATDTHVKDHTVTKFIIHHQGHTPSDC